MIYPRMVTPESPPFDPLEVAMETEKIVCRNDQRKYTAYYCTGVYGGISTAYTVGCCLRCIFCWVSSSRDYPERYGKFYSAEEVFKKLDENAKRRGYKRLRISGGEPTIGRKHLTSVLKFVEETDYFFVLETNGILIGNDRDYAEELSKFKNVYIRVSLKAGTAEGFQSRTGAIGKFYELPYQAIRNLKDAGAPSFRVAAMSDPRLMPAAERKEMLRKVREIDPALLPLEEETCDPYAMTVVRLKAAGWYEKVYGK